MKVSIIMHSPCNRFFFIVQKVSKIIIDKQSGAFELVRRQTFNSILS